MKTSLCLVLIGISLQLLAMDSPQGALVRVTANGTVGVLLDELPPALRDRVASELAAKPGAFWTERAKAQMRLSRYRLVFREYYYGWGAKKQLPLPPEPAWNITLGGPPQRTVVDGHDLVLVPYAYESTLLTDEASPGKSEPKLKKVGGSWTETIVFPIDPELLLQRTGYACIDEAEFPFGSVDSEEVDSFYDDFCGVEAEADGFFGCHQTELPQRSCVQALQDEVGRVTMSIRFDRIPWDSALAASVRVYPPTAATADLQVYVEDFQQNRVEYKYFAADACELAEECIGGPGWRRVLQFHSSDQNRGMTTLEIGAVDYFLKGNKETLNDRYNIFELHGCHDHYHFSHYGSFSFDAPGASTTNKQGFCLQSTDRTGNHEQSPLHHDYSGCDFQGVEAGWVDQYKIGLPCQWVDVTNVPASQPVTANLSFSSNPDGFLCEGTPVLDARGNPVFEPTEFTNHDGETIWRQVCDYEPGALENNVETYAATIPKTGESYVNEPCTRGQLGPLRNCGWAFNQRAFTCTPGQNARLSCTVTPNKPPQVVRVCERSATLGTAMSCKESMALASSVVDGSGAIDFICPMAREEGEPGGSFSVMTGPAFPDDADNVRVDCTLD